MNLNIKVFSTLWTAIFVLLLYSVFYDIVEHTNAVATYTLQTNQSTSELPSEIDLVSSLIFEFIALLSLLLIAVLFIRKQYVAPLRSIQQGLEHHLDNHQYKQLISSKALSAELILKTFGTLSQHANDLQKRLDFSQQLGKQAWFDLDPINEKILVGEGYALLLGFRPEEFSTDLSNWQNRVHPEDLELLNEAFLRAIKNDNTVEVKYRIRNNVDRYVWLQSVGQTVARNSQGKSTRVIAVQTDISETKVINLKEKTRSNVLELLVNASPLKLILESILNILEQEDQGIICSILLLDKDEKRLFRGATCGLPEAYNEAINGIEIGANVGSCGTAAYTKKRVIVENIQSHPYWQGFTELAAEHNLASCWSEPIIGSEGKILGTFAIYHSKPSAPQEHDFKIIDYVSKLTAIAIERSNVGEQVRLYSRVFSDTHEAIIITDPLGQIVEVNPAFCNITGYKREEVLGKNPSFLSSGEHDNNFYKDMWNSIINDGHWQGEVHNSRKNGELFIESLSISSLTDTQGKPLYYVGLFSDITDIIKQQDKLKHMAHYDVLTQLPNRTLFTDRIYQAIAHSKRYNKKLAIGFLDLDNFKPVNDNFGHEVGDKLLVEVAKRISSNIREEDTASRQGGDEFTLLLGDIDSYELCALSLQRILDALAEPYFIDGKQHKITASCGVTIYPDDSADVDTLLRHADHAMYQAKLIGKNHYQLFNTEKNQEKISKNHLLLEIESALVNQQLCLYYQPKVNMRTGEVFGVEALIRWQHPDRGLIPPIQFLPVLDGSALELRVGEWVIKTALQQLEYWNSQGLDLEVSVNISSYHLQSSNFLRFLSESLSEYPSINPEKLQLEVLESSVLGDIELISKTLKSCQQSLGINIALDDFGTGYSSLTHMRSLPTDTIKIDRSFIRDVLDDPGDYVIVDGVIGLARSFERKVIAEGVESSEHGLILLMMGCDLAQGYHIARPMPAEDFIEWNLNNIPEHAWLDWGSVEHSEEQNKLALFRLTCEWWKNHFASNILKLPEQISHWPIEDKTQCHCGRWLERAIQEALFDQKLLYQLDVFHKEIHSTSDKLRELYLSGEIEKAREGLSEVESLFTSMDKLLSDYS